MRLWYGEQPVEDRGPIGAYCLWWAVHTVEVLLEEGFRAQIQAGSAFWRRVRPDQDDGVVALNYGYEFGDDEPALVRDLMLGRLPEMHVWAAVLDAGGWQVVDVTTGFWPEQALRLGGYDWPGDAPPDYLWVRVAEFPGNLCRYAPDRRAIAIAYRFVQNCGASRR